MKAVSLLFISMIEDFLTISTTFVSDGYTTKKMSLKWKKGFDQSKVKVIFLFNSTSKIDQIYEIKESRTFL